ncbi:MAG: PAS domain S-box protein [Deltaproteobacteria bacterium]|nr:PAS domain S-box protein [Deltaproteobacteria bacterium]
MNNGVNVKLFLNYPAYIVIAGICLTLLSLPGLCSARDRIILTDQKGKYPLGLHLEILEDPGRQLTIDDVTSVEFNNKFIPSQLKVPNFGYTNSAYWVRFQVRNQAVKIRDWILELGYACMHYIDLYIPVPGGKGFSVRKTGILRPVETRDIDHHRFVFHLPLAFEKEQTIYLRFSGKASITLPLAILSRQAFNKSCMIEYFSMGIFYGIFSIMLVYIIFMFLFLRKASYLHFCFFLFSIILFEISYSGLGAKYIWQDQIFWNRISVRLFICLIIITLLNFSNSFLLLKKNIPILYKINTITQIFAGILIFFILFTQYQCVKALLILMIFGIIMSCVQGLISWIRGFKPARFFVIAWLFPIYGVSINIMIRFGLIPSSDFSENLYQKGIVWLVFISSVALIDQINRFFKKTEISRQKFRATFNQTFQFMGLLTPAGAVVNINKTALDFAGIKEPEVIGLPFWETPWWNHSNKMQDRIKKAISQSASGRLVRFEAIHPDLKGIFHTIDFSIKPLKDKNGKVTLLIPEGRDITDKKQIEERLNNERERYLTLVEKSPLGVTVIGKDSSYKYINQKFIEIFGYTIADIPTRKEWFIKAYPDEEYRKQAFLTWVSDKENSKVGEDRPRTFKVMCKNGVEKLIHFRAVTMKTGEQFMTYDDITERVRMEEVMIQTEKMMSVGGLAAGMAHEINNPLAGILQSIQVIQKRISENLQKNKEVAKECGTSLDVICLYMEKREINSMMARITEAGKRAAKIVKNMLSFSRNSQSQSGFHDLTKLMDDSVELAGNDYDLKKKFDFRQIKIIRKYSANIPLVNCDGSRIQQVFLNILQNGAQAMAGAENYNKGFKNPQFILCIYPDDNMICIEIEDNGPGMDEKTRKRAFEPFFTTKAVGLGTGLGLSVSYFIVTENHKGTIHVESSPGKGAKFTIRLPL